MGIGASRRVALALTLALASTTAACMRGDCNASFPFAGALVAVEDGPPGAYRVEVDAAGETVAADLTVGGAAASVTVRGTATYLAVTTSWPVEPPPTFMVNVADLAYHGGPDQFTLRVLRDGALVTTAGFTPDYRISEPNGDGCGEIARADLTLTLP